MASTMHAHTDDAPPASPRTLYKRMWQERKRRSSGVKPVEIAPCGTPAAYRRHLRNSESVDDACLEAWRRNAQEARERAAIKKRIGEIVDAPVDKDIVHAVVDQVMETQRAGRDVSDDALRALVEAAARHLIEQTATG
jgi:hypothetical protein